MTAPTPAPIDTASLPSTVPNFMCEERRSVTARLGVSDDQLKRAVRAVGSKLSRVRMYLGK